MGTLHVVQAGNFLTLLLLCRTLGQNADNERNHNLENDVNLAKSLQQYLKYLGILSQSAATNLYPRKTNDKASVKVVFLMWFLHSAISVTSLNSPYFSIFPSILRPNIVSHCLLQLIVVAALTKFSPNEMSQLQHCK